MDSPEIILEIKNGTFGYRGRQRETVLLRETDLHLRVGELVCLIGRNGSGKSTLLKTIMKIIPQLGGEITLMGKDLRSYQPSEMARTCGFVPSGLVNAGEMTVRELVELGRYPYTNWYGRLAEADASAVDEAIASVGLQALEGNKVDEISDGEKQRGMIARTLAQSTGLILLDEPSAFLDVPNKYGISMLLRTLCDRKHSVIFSTHDLNLALHYADKIWLIDNGRISEGAPEDLILDGRIRNLFTSEKISFDMLTGDFRPVPAFRGSVFLDPAADLPGLRVWTLKALHRAGFRNTGREENADLIVRIKIENDRNVWNVQQENENLFFHSIYELTLHLKKLKNEPG